MNAIEQAREAVAAASLDGTEAPAWALETLRAEQATEPEPTENPVLPAEPAQETLPADSLVITATGDVYDLSTAAGCAEALAGIQKLTGMLHDARSVVVGELVEHRRQLGTSTFNTPAGKVTLSADEERVVDATVLREGLVAADAPEDLIGEVIVQTVSEKVDLRRADRAAANNEAYAAALAAATTFRPKRVNATLDAKAATIDPGA